MSKAQAKIDRVMAALEHREADRVPVNEGFWTNFVRRCRRELNVGEDFDPRRYWDIDMTVLVPNMDPHITGIRVVEKSLDRLVVKTGFGATIESKSVYPMPHYADFDTKSFEQMEAMEFDDPADPRRYFDALDDQINCVGDALCFGQPPFVEKVKSCADDFCVFGSVCEPHEMIWRIMGTENVLMKMAEDPDRYAKLIEKVGDFLVGVAEGQIRAAAGKLSGLVLWGDVAYDHGMFFSPAYWRDVYKPQVARLCRAAHDAGIKIIYHGCGNASAIYDDLIDAGIDGYNPLECKAGLDVVELKRKYKGRLAFDGNIDVRILSTNDREKVRREVLRKLNAAKGGGYIFHSDHSIPDSVAPATYSYAMELVREFGRFPLQLGEFDESV
jgi:hypothetical protein